MAADVESQIVDVPRAPSRSTRTPLRTAGFLILLSVAAWFLAPPAPAMDDVYIAVQSAHAIVDGRDPAYGVPALVGATSPPHVALLASLLALGLSDLSAVRAAVTLGMLAYIAALWALVRANELRGWRVPVFLTLALVCGDTYLQVTNGLETAFALAAVTGALAATFAGRFHVAALLIGLLPCLRPDLALVAAALWAYAVWASPASLRMRVLVIPVLVAMPWILWAYVDTGRLVPNTANAKRYFMAEQCGPFTARLATTAQWMAIWFVSMFPLTIGGSRIVLTAIGRLVAGAVAATLLAYVVTFPAGVANNGMRYLYPLLLPLLLCGTAAQLRGGSRAWIAVSIGMLAAFSVTELRTALLLRPAAQELVDLRAWVGANLPAGARIASHDAGLIALTGHPIVDLVGLKTLESMEVHRSLTWPSCGARRTEAFKTILARLPAEYLLVADDWEQRFGIARAANAGEVLFDGFRYRVYRLPALHGAIGK